MTTLAFQAANAAQPRPKTRLSTGLAIEAFLVVNVLSYYLAFLFRCEFTIPAEVFTWLWTTLPVVLGVKAVLLMIAFTKVNAASEGGVKSNYVIFVSATLAAVGIYVLNISLFEAYLHAIPRSVIAMDWALSLIFWMRLRAIGLKLVKGTAFCEREAKPRRQQAIPTISMGSGGPKVSG